MQLVLVRLGTFENHILLLSSALQTTVQVCMLLSQFRKLPVEIRLFSWIVSICIKLSVRSMESDYSFNDLYCWWNV